jgi:hypothetical protein
MYELHTGRQIHTNSCLTAIKSNGRHDGFLRDRLVSQVKLGMFNTAAGTNQNIWCMCIPVWPLVPGPIEVSCLGFLGAIPIAPQRGARPPNYLGMGSARIYTATVFQNLFPSPQGSYLGEFAGILWSRSPRIYGCARAVIPLSMVMSQTKVLGASGLTLNIYLTTTWMLSSLRNHAE